MTIRITISSVTVGGAAGPGVDTVIVTGAAVVGTQFSNVKKGSESIKANDGLSGLANQPLEVRCVHTPVIKGKAAAGIMAAGPARRRRVS